MVDTNCERRGFERNKHKFNTTLNISPVFRGTILQMVLFFKNREEACFRQIAVQTVPARQPTVRMKYVYF